MGVIDTAAGRIGVADNGTRGGLPILFLHGVGSDKSVWTPQLDHYRGRRPAIAIDYPGYGDSALLPGATRDDYARAAFTVLDSLGHGPAHICGLSLGGVVAIAMHALAPGRCESLILADTFAVHPDGQAIYDRSITASRDLRALAEARVDVLLAQPSDPDLRAEVVETMAAIDPPAYRLGAEAVWLADQTDRVAAITAPTLVLCGALDAVTPPALSEALAGAIGGAKLTIIAGAGHLANIEKPAEFNAAVDRFLLEVEQKA
ncbi:MAG TPA: alpha/beta fold hydrolase [Sphingomicrobium sp.]|nr:alpha/beta fold hydrolase [Sphingomicrobium sp.]